MRANRLDLPSARLAPRDDLVPPSEGRPDEALSARVSVAILLCTRERSRRLEECLRSIGALSVPEHVDPAIVVVENDAQPACQGLVLRLAALMPRWQIRYSHEPRLGIPIARNHALAVALEMNFDWIAFIDDDETVAPDWLEAMIKASQTFEADVLQGPVDYVYPSDAPAWLNKKRLRNRPSGTPLRTAYTNNVMMRARVARSDGLGMTFDERLRFTGGSDSDYYSRAADKGAVIRWVGEASVREVVTAERLTMAWQANRALRVAANASSLHSRRFGHLKSIGRYGPKSLSRILGGLVTMSAAVPVRLASKAAAQRIFFQGLKQASSGIGGIAPFFNFKPQPYIRVDGDGPHGLPGTDDAEARSPPVAAA
jgi:succinoglycan biosynthesis protein ExoM